MSFKGVTARSIGRLENHNATGNHNNSVNDYSNCENNVATVYELPSIQDVTIDGINTHEKKNYLEIGKMPRSGIARTLIKFEKIPKSCELVVNAEMYVYYKESHIWPPRKMPFNTKSIELRQVLKSWTETEATSFKRHRKQNWATLNLQLNDTDARSHIESFHNITENTLPGYISFDITGMTQRWITGEENHGVLLSLADEKRAERRVRLHSREVTEGKPYLRVKCWSEFCPSTSMKTGLEQPSKENINPTNGYENADGARNPKIMISGGATYTLPANSYARKQ